MANVEHSTLTGSDLHESKGVAAAAANRVYLSNGAGSGSWTTVPAAAISAAGVLVFQSQKYHVRDTVSSGVASQGALTNNTWNTRRINTEMIDDITASIASNQITLPSGTYWLEGWITQWSHLDCQNGGSVSMLGQPRLRNVTDSITLLTGGGINVFLRKDNAGSTYREDQLIIPIRGVFTVGASKALELQHFLNGTGSGGISNSAGIAVSSGENETYLDLAFWKLA